MSDHVKVQIIHLGKEHVFRQTLQLPSGSTVMQAVEASGVEKDLESGAVDPAQLGIFSRRVQPDTVVADGDRIEIYRTLEADPKTARRRRAGSAG